MMKRVQLLLLTLLAGVFLAAAQNLNTVGDVNLDGEVTVADVNSVINVILSDAINPAADVNNDGEINIADINFIIDIILNPVTIPDNVHVYGDAPGAEGDVLSVTDETVVLTCPSGEEPIVGDIIVSGVTDDAPYGFLRHVEAVEKTRSGVIVTTTNASLEEVLPDGDYHIDIPLVMPGQQNSFNSASQAPSRVKFSTDFKGTIKIGWKGDIPDVKFDVWPFMTPEQEKKKEDEVLNGAVDSFYPLQFIAKVSPSLNLIFDCKVKKRKLQRVELGGELEVKAELLLKATLEKEFKRVGENGLILPGSIDMAPVTVMAGPVPVVFTPKLHFSLGVDLKGELYMQFKLMSASASGSFSYVYTSDPDPVTGQKHNFYKDFETSTLGDGDMEKRFQKWLAPKVGVKGSAKGILSPMPDVSLYNANDIFHVSTPLSPWAKVGGNLSITLDPSNSSELDYEDNVTLTGGVDIGIAAVFKLLGKKETWEKDFTLFETELMEPLALTPSFDELRITPDDDPIPATTPAIEFGTYMTKPNIQVLPDQDYGFAYGPKDTENRTATWTFVSLKDQYDPEFDGDTYKHEYIQTSIDPATVEPGVPYRVSPYLQLFGYKIFKKGENFTLDDSTPCVTVPMAEVDFGDVLVGACPTQVLDIVNNSSIPQTVKVEVTSPFSIAYNESSMSSRTIEVPGNSCSPVTIMFTATSEGDYLGTATFTSNAIEGGTCVVPLHGSVVTDIVPQNDYVDLGLPSGTLWATCNIGASSPEDYGDYFAWGETEPKNNYDWSTYKWCDGDNNTLTKYCTSSSYGTVDNKTELSPEDDAAYMNWGSSWRMPTLEQQQELLESCNWNWTTRNGINGWLVIGPNGNSIFMPAAGNIYRSSLREEGSTGFYWSRTLDSGRPNSAYNMLVELEGMGFANGGRYAGFTVRAVREETNSPQTETITVNGVSFNMVRVEGGTFMMGAADVDSEAWSGEKPAHQVTVSSFAIAQTEVTQALWQEVMGSNPSYFTGDLNRPVERISWNDCQTFITKLNERTGRNFRLPTEAEWEFAARGGNLSQSYKYSGSNDIDEVAWYYDNSYALGSSSPDYGTHAVATKAPNELGLYDMSGNVWEWVQDWWSYYSSDAQTNPAGPTTGSLRVVRGGGWRGYSGSCRVSNRDHDDPSNTISNLGLRLAL